MATDPTIPELVALQGRLGLTDRHIVWLGPEGFVIAHTDEERASIDLWADCELHSWLTGRGAPPEVPCVPGYYVARPHVPDAYSESYRVDLWEFESLDVLS